MYSGASHAKNQTKSIKSMKIATNYPTSNYNEANFIKTGGKFS